MSSSDEQMDLHHQQRTNLFAGYEQQQQQQRYTGPQSPLYHYQTPISGEQSQQLYEHQASATLRPRRSDGGRSQQQHRHSYHNQMPDETTGASSYHYANASAAELADNSSALTSCNNQLAFEANLMGQSAPLGRQSLTNNGSASANHTSNASAAATVVSAAAAAAVGLSKTNPCAQNGHQQGQRKANNVATAAGNSNKLNYHQDHHVEHHNRELVQADCKCLWSGLRDLLITSSPDSCRPSCCA